MEISFSRFRIYRECPWKYKLQFVDGKRPKLDPPASLGISLHRALERYHAGGEPEWQALADAYDLEFLRSGYADPSERAKWSKKGLRLLQAYYETELSRRTEVVASEREFIFALGAHTVRGMIDRIDRHPDGRYELIDYKTREGAETSDLQLRFYALGAKKAFGYDVGSISVHYLTENRVESKPYDASGEEALQRDIVETAEAIEAGRFGPDTRFCPRCVFKHDCAFSVAR